MKTIKEMGEFGLIDRIKARFEPPEGTLGIGDDCAVLPSVPDDTLVTTDMLVEDIHFLRSDITPEDLGWKSAAVNLSDIAAMGGEPTGTFLSIALPVDLEVEWAERFIDGYAAISRLCNVPLLGGDTTASERAITVSVTALGACPHRTALLRSSAEVGDLICVTGTLGDSGAGLKAILSSVSRTEDVKKLIERHYRPTPRIAEGIALRLSGAVHAMMDISDGIASDIRHIMSSSGVGADIDLSLLPMSRELLTVCEAEGWDAAEIAAAAGEDYELLFTVDPDRQSEIKVPHTVIGRVNASGKLAWLKGGLPAMFSKKGFTHF